MTPTLSVETQEAFIFFVYIIAMFGCWCVFVWTLAEIVGLVEEWIAEDMSDDEQEI